MSSAPSFVILGGGPAGHEAATYAARLGARLTLIERDVVGGAAHLLDCVPEQCPEKFVQAVVDFPRGS